MKKSAQAFRTISEVAAWLDTPNHVLRFWESKFKQIKPIKRAGRRYYRLQDMQVLGGVKVLLHGEGLTIKRVQGLLADEGLEAVMARAPSLDALIASEPVEDFVEDSASDFVEEVAVEETQEQVVMDAPESAPEHTPEPEQEKTLVEIFEDRETNETTPLLEAMGDTAPAEPTHDTPAPEPTHDTPAEPAPTPPAPAEPTLGKDEIRQLYTQLKEIRARMGQTLAALP